MSSCEEEGAANCCTSRLYSVIPRPVVENWEEHGHTCESSQQVLT